MQTAIMMAEAYRDKALKSPDREAVAAASLMEGAKEALEWVNGEDNNRFAKLVKKTQDAIRVISQ